MLMLILMQVVTYCAIGCPLDEAELFEKRRLAAQGDSKQALELFEYHGYRNEMNDSLFWLRVAAEQGDCSGMSQHAQIIGGTGMDHEGKKLWMRVAEERGCDISDIDDLPPMEGDE